MQLDVTNKPMVARALYAATAHHEGIKRKYCGEPYINHPVRVAEILLLFGHVSEEILSAALLHDCLEDENLAGEKMQSFQIRSFTNDRVTRWVELLSNTEKGNRKERKAKAAIRIMNAPWQVQAIKLADILDNCKGISQQDPGFAEVYIEEKRNMVNMIRRTDELDGMIDAAKELLGDEMNALALWRLENGKKAQAEIVKRDQQIDAILLAEERSVYAEVALF